MKKSGYFVQSSNVGISEFGHVSELKALDSGSGSICEELSHYEMGSRMLRLSRLGVLKSRKREQKGE